MNCIKCKTELPPDAVFCHICGRKQTRSTRTPKSRGNGQGSVYKRGNTWTAQFTSYAAHERITKHKGGFATKKEALAYMERLRNQKRESKVAELWEIFKENTLPSLSQARQIAHKKAYERLSTLRTMKMSDLTIGLIQNCVNENANSHYTARDMKSLLSHLFKMAMAQQEVSVNLSQFIKLPALDESEPAPFTDDELKALWTHYESDASIGYILLMIYSGMMPGELMKCQKHMIDYDRQEIIGCGLKTKKRKETPIVFPEFIIPVLDELAAISPTNFLLDMKKNQFYDWFKNKMHEVGCRELTPYACRHTTATALALGNEVAPSVIQKVMRHSKITTTQRYIHPDTGDMVSAVNTLKKRL